MSLFRFDAVFREELRTNWPVLLLAFSCLFFGFSAPAFALPFLFAEVIKEFGWTREEATLLASAKYLVGAVSALMVGRFLDITVCDRRCWLRLAWGDWPWSAFCGYRTSRPTTSSAP